MSLKNHSILFAPAHYITGRDVGGSELQWAFDIVSQAARRFGTVDAVLCDLRNGSFPANVRVHAFDRNRHVNYFDVKESARFIMRYTRVALPLCRPTPPSILHHAFPWGARTFNPLILGRGTLLGADRATRIVMGPLQQPTFGVSTVAEEGMRFTPDLPPPSADPAAKQGLSFGPLEPALRRLCTATLARADAIVAISNPAKSFVENLGVRVPIHVVPAGVRLEDFPPVDRSGRNARVQIAVVAYLIKRKNVDLVLAAVAKARARGHDVVLDVAGDGPERPALEMLAGKLGIADAVRWRGYVANADIAQIYAHADLFVTMSRFDPHPPAVLEAMASGLPVISTPTDGAREIIEDGVTGSRVPFDDADALAARVEQYADSAALRTQHGAAARQRIAQRFSWDAVGDRYAALYESLLAPSAPKNDDAAKT